VTASAARRSDGVSYDDTVAALYDHDAYGIYRRSHDDLLALLPEGEHFDRVLDVGCGTGTVLSRVRERFTPAETFGLDPSVAMLARAKEKVPGLIAVHGDDDALVHDTRLRDLGLVLASFVMAYSSPERLIARVKDTLKPGGTFATVTTTLNSFQELLAVASHPIFRVISTGYDISPETVQRELPPVPKNADALRAALEAGGFDVIELRPRTHPIEFVDGRSVYRFGIEGGWWLDLYQRLKITEKSAIWIHLALRTCQLLGILEKPCRTSMETVAVIARRRG
jgi:SAM-dependent methyltransferase